MVVPQEFPKSVLHSRTRRRVKKGKAVSKSESQSRNIDGIASVTEGEFSDSSKQRRRKAQHDFLFIVALVSWFTLGVLSISTTKLLLSQSFSSQAQSHSPHSLSNTPAPPLLLTVQQFAIGSFLLSALTRIFPRSNTTQNRQTRQAPKASLLTPPWRLIKSGPNLLFAAVAFALGFYGTNVGFRAASASFVETIKASEPLTSAALSVGMGQEKLTLKQWMALMLLILGMVISTLANASSDTTTSSSISSTTFQDSLMACAVVLLSNLCFSTRGFFQKRLQREHTSSNIKFVRVVELQCQMQQVGVWILGIPLVLQHLIVRGDLEIQILNQFTSWRYLAISTVNGASFTFYNLASTYILSRISVVHHAVFNCCRRVFAIIATSILFRVPVTWIGVLGMSLSFSGFLVFAQEQQHKKTETNNSKQQMMKEKDSAVADSTYSLHSMEAGTSNNSATSDGF